MLENLKKLKKDIKHIHRELQSKDKDIEEIRSHYKYQTEDTRSISEDLIVIYKNLELDAIIERLDELIDYEKDQGN